MFLKFLIIFIALNEVFARNWKKFSPDELLNNSSLLEEFQNDFIDEMLKEYNKNITTYKLESMLKIIRPPPPKKDLRRNYFPEWNEFKKVSIWYWCIPSFERLNFLDIYLLRM